MKWFKHDCDMHTDFKILSLIEKDGIEGYAIWLLCLEFLGKEGEKRSKNGKKWSLDSQTRWQEHLLKVSGWSDNNKLTNILNTLAELRLICPKSLKYGNLYCPKFRERADDYTMRKLRILSELDTEKVLVDKIRIDKIRIEYIKLKNWQEKDLLSDDYARIHKAIKNLLLKAKGNDKMAIEAINWVAKQGYCDWTMETVVKKYQDFISFCPKCQNKGKYTNERGYIQICDCSKGKLIQSEDNPRL